MSQKDKCLVITFVLIVTTAILKFVAGCSKDNWELAHALDGSALIVSILVLIMGLIIAILIFNESKAS